MGRATNGQTDTYKVEGYWAVIVAFELSPDTVCRVGAGCMGMALIACLPMVVLIAY